MPGSETNPTAAYPQVNPRVSVEAVGLSGSEKGQLYNEAPQTFTTNDDPYRAGNPGENPQPDSGTETHGLTCGNNAPATRQNLAWPTAPAWAARWQAKINAARLPVQRADAAWRALRAAANKARLSDADQDALFGRVADWLLARANELAPTPAPKPAPPPEPVRDLRGNVIAPPYDPEEYR